VNLENKNKNKFKILALHTTITEAINDSNPEGSKFMNSVSASKLPEGFDYYALGHIHAYFKKNIDGKLIVYPGPLFPNNFAEMKTLKSGNFCIVSVSDDKKIKIENKKIDLNVEVLDIDASGKEPQQLTKEIIEKIWPLKDKIITLKISGKINGNTSEIPFVRINEEAEKNGCVLLKNTSDLENPEFKTEFEIKETDIENIEHEIIKKVSEENSSEFNKLISILMKSLNIEKQEGETTLTYEKRLAQDIEKIIGIA
jgi:DNA repair exonuclease SbcCD nuclease subunit